MTLRLANRVVATTRDGSPEDPLVHGLSAEGAHVVVWPTLAFVSTVVGVALLHDEVKVAAVGAATARAFADTGWAAAVIGDGLR